MKIESIFKSLDKTLPNISENGNFSEVIDALAAKKELSSIVSAQREIYQLHYKVELASRVGEATTGLVKRLQQGS